MIETTKKEFNFALPWLHRRILSPSQDVILGEGFFNKTMLYIDANEN